MSQSKMIYDIDTVQNTIYIHYYNFTTSRNKIHKHIHWALGNGEINFWEDILWGDKTLSSMCNPGVNLQQRRVKDFWENGEWNMALLTGTLKPLGVPREVIGEIGKIPIESGGKDMMRWACTTHGEFSTKSAWELCRQRLPQSPVLKLIWSEHLLPSMSIFIWRLLANSFPVDAKLQWRKISLASKCRCCPSPDVETREHLFLQGEVARAVWEMVATWFPNLPRWNVGVTNLEARISFWHRRLCYLDRTHAIAVIPGLVLWLIWSERDSCIHRNTSFNASNIINRIKNYLQQLITVGKMGKEHWRGCGNTENLITSLRKQIRQVRWIPPAQTGLKSIRLEYGVAKYCTFLSYDIEG